MEFHQLRYFVEVARQKNFSRAAAVCNVAQPSLSQQIKKLELELGQPLIVRGRQGAQLTEFGESMLPQALLILSSARKMQEEANLENGEISGRISIGAIPTMAPYLLPQLVQQVLTRYPTLELSLVENTTDELVRQLREGSLDFALLSPPFEGEPDMVLDVLRADELLIVLPDAHPLAKLQELKLLDLSEFPMVVMKDVHCLSRQSRSVCDASGLKPSVALESSQMETVISMVEAGMGFSFIPEIARQTFAHRNICFASIAPTPASRQICLVSSKYQQLSPPQLAFQQAVKDTLAATREQ